MFDYFITYRTEIPEGLGWDHFGAIHLSYLVLFAIGCVVMALVYRRANERLRRHIKIIWCCVVVGLEIIKDAICLVTGVFEPGLVPFHLCGMTIIFIVIHTVKPNRTTAELLYSLSIPGALAALLFSDWNFYPLANFFCQQSFFIHFFELSFPIMLIAAGEIRPRFTQLWRCVLYLLIVVPPIYFFNKAFDTNFFFINEAAADSPLSFLQALMGNPGYLFGFAGLLAIVWVVMYLPWIIKTWREKRAYEVGID
jgi:hypothetical integral membrane protein (TIGR02206 family)